MSKIFIKHARDLRKHSTNAEQLLWRHLRAKRMSDFKFRRQQPIGSYIVDFLCCEKKVVIELDGGQHNILQEKDKLRDSRLEKQGFRVLRFWNNEVFSNTDGVLQTILDACSRGNET